MNATGWFLCGLGTGIIIALTFCALLIGAIWNDLTRIVRYER